MAKGKIILNIKPNSNSIESTFGKRGTINCMRNLADLLGDKYSSLRFKRIKS